MYLFSSYRAEIAIFNFLSFPVMSCTIPIKISLPSLLPTDWGVFFDAVSHIKRCKKQNVYTTKKENN